MAQATPHVSDGLGAGRESRAWEDAEGGATHPLLFCIFLSKTLDKS